MNIPELKSHYFKLVQINNNTNPDVIITVGNSARLYQGSISEIPQTLNKLLEKLSSEVWDKCSQEKATALSYFYNAVSLENGFHPVHAGDVDVIKDYEELMDKLNKLDIL